MTRYPIFVPTKGRYQTPYTIRAFQEIGLDFRAVIEEQELAAYSKVLDKNKILILPHRNKGLVTTRNWIWDYAASLGVKRFWTFDDNIDGLYRLNNNLKVSVKCDATLRAIEDFTDRYENVAISGMNYFMFAKRKDKLPPFIVNTRVYSNMLIETGIPFRNEGFYNDDTDLCLRVLKAGLCTVQFNAFLIYKMTTMTVKGGMTPHYQGDGRRKMAEELKAKHPDVTTITYKFGHWQHQVDYSGFTQRLHFRKDCIAREGIDNYGMRLEVDEVRDPEEVSAEF